MVMFYVPNIISSDMYTCLHLKSTQNIIKKLFMSSGIDGSRTGKSLIGRHTTTVFPNSQDEAPWLSPPRGMKTLASFYLFIYLFIFILFFFIFFFYFFFFGGGTIYTKMKILYGSQVDLDFLFFLLFF